MFSLRAIAISSLLCLAAATPALAVEPVGPEWRVSYTGPDGDPSYRVSDAAVAHNPQLDQYLVVWSAEHAPNETEIFARLYAGEGTPLGEQFRVSQMGLDDDGVSEATAPDVVYDPTQNRYLVAWAGDNGEPLSNNEFEIYAQRLDAAGDELGTDFRVSDMGTDGSAAADAASPALAHNAATGEYLLVWTGDDGSVPLKDDEYEIFGQRLTASGAAIGANDFRISQMGTDGDPVTDTTEPAVAANALSGEFLVVWGGDDTPPLHGDDFHYFAQRLGPTGAAIGTNDFQVSDHGPESWEMNNGTDVVFNPARAEYLVAWHGNASTTPGAELDFEILGQRLSDSGAELGADDFRISHTEPSEHVPSNPALALDPAGGGYLVAWQSDDDPLALDHYEIFAQQLTPDGVEVGADDMRVSATGPMGAYGSSGWQPALAWSPQRGEALVAWEAAGVGALDSYESEIYARRLGTPPLGEAGPQGQGETEPSELDTSAPALTLRAARRQRLRRDRRIAVRAACDEACAVAVSAAVRIAGRRRPVARTGSSQPLAAAARTRVRLRLSRRGAARVLRALRGGRRVTVAFAATATDAAGNASRGQARSRLVRR
jgi:hypothetical protein